MFRFVGTNKNPREQGKRRKWRDSEDNKHTNIHTKKARELPLREEISKKFLCALGSFRSFYFLPIHPI